MSRNGLWLIAALLILGAVGTALLGWELTGEHLVARHELPALPDEATPPEALAGGPEASAPVEVPERQVVPEELPEQVPVPPGELLGRVVDTGARGKAGVQILLLESAPPAAPRGARTAKAPGPEDLQERLEEVRRMAGMRIEMEAKYRASGQPLDQVQAHLDRMRQQSGFKEMARTVSDAEGYFRFPRPAAPDPGKALLVQALGPADYLPAEVLVISAEQLEAGRLPDIVLIQPGIIRGIVTGLQGERSRAEVVAWRLGEDESLERLSRWVPPGGLYALENLHPGTWRLSLHQRWGDTAFQWGPVIELAEGEIREGVNLAFSPDCALELLLLGPGRSPLEAVTQVGLTLRRLGPRGEPGGEIAVEQNLGSVSPPVGEPCRFDKLSPGLYRVEAELVGLAGSAGRGAKGGQDDYGVAKEVELTAGFHRMELVFPKMPRLGSLDVLVTDADGAPLRDARVTLIGQASGPGQTVIRSVGGGSRTAITDSKGVASFQGLVPLRYRISVWAMNYIGGNDSFDLKREGEGAHVQRELVLLQAAACRGQVVDAGGQGIAGVLVRLTQSGQGERWTRGTFSFSNFGSHAAVTDAQGRFQLHNLPGGRWDVLATIRGGASATETVRLVPGRTTETTIRL